MGNIKSKQKVITNDTVDKASVLVKEVAALSQQVFTHLSKLQIHAHSIGNH